MPTVDRGLLRGRLLLDGDRRRQALDRVDVRLAHQLQELPRVGGQRLDVAALALGVDRIEGERGLARPGQAGEHGQAVARNDHIHVFQIVLARAAHMDGAGHEFGCAFRRKWLRSLIVPARYGTNGRQREGVAIECGRGNGAAVAGGARGFLTTGGLAWGRVQIVRAGRIARRDLGRPGRGTSPDGWAPPVAWLECVDGPEERE